MKRFSLILILFCLLSNQVKAGQEDGLPKLSIKTLKDENFNLAEKKGKIIIINYWAKWCIDCRKEMPVLEELYQQYKDQGVEIIGISIDRINMRQKVEEVAASVSYKNAMIWDALENSFPRPNAIPVSYVIDQKGRVVTKVIPTSEGSIKQEFEKVLKPLLKKSK